MRLDIVRVDLGLAGLDDELAALRHGIARVDREVEERVLDLAGVDHGHRQIGGEPGLDLHLLAQAPPQEVDHPAYELVDVGRLWAQGLPPTEGEQASGELCAELGGTLSLLDELAMRWLVDPRLEHLEIPGDHGQEIVEIVGEAAGEL